MTTLPCVEPQPSYARDVVPVLDRDCNQTCHAPGAGPWPLVGYQDVRDWSFPIQAAIQGCTMPPVDAGPLPSADRTVILDWIACGANNN